MIYPSDVAIALYSLPKSIGDGSPATRLTATLPGHRGLVLQLPDTNF